MREIKFRGKRLDNGEWVVGSLFNSIWRKSADGSRVCYIFPDNMLDDNGGGDCWEDFAEVAEQYEVAPATVGQFTGLKDNNGRDIWEGDIFKEYGSGIVRSVFRVPGGLAFEDNPVSFGYDHRAPVYPYSSIAEMQSASWLSQCCEVIGNIHDNPELLKTE